MLSLLLSFCIGLLLLIGVACLFISLFKRRFEECAPLAVAAVFLLLYFLVLLGLIKLAIPAVCLLAAAGVALFLVQFFRKKDRDAFSRLLTPGFVVFLIVPVAACVLINATVDWVFGWDEYSHWILAVKELWLTDAGEVAFRSLVIMPYYPPFTALIGFFFLKIGGAYSEPMTYVANVVISVSLLIPIMRTFPWKKVWQAVVVAAVLCLMPLIFFVDAIAMLYVDSLMGLLIGYILYIYFASPKKDLFTWLSVSAGICMLSMIKNNGVEVCLVPLAILFADWLFVQRKSPSVPRTKKQTIVLFLVCACVMFLAHGAWHLFLRGIDVRSDFVNNADSVSYLESFPAEYQIEGYRTAFALLFADRPTGKVTLSILSICALLVLLGLYIVYRARGSKEYKSLCFFVGGTAFGLFAYAALIALAISVTFIPPQVRVMLSFERYVDTYLLAMLYAFIGVLLERRREETGMLCTIAVLCALMPFTSVTESFNFMEEREMRQERKDRYTTAVATLEQLTPHVDRVCYVDQANTKFGFYYLTYLMSPLDIEFEGGWNIGIPEDQYDPSTVYVEENEWAQMVIDSDCNYVFIHNVNDYFVEHFGKFFASPDDIAIDTLYHITEPAAGTLLLVPAS